jgi:hypothetical protein
MNEADSRSVRRKEMNRTQSRSKSDLKESLLRLRREVLERGRSSARSLLAKRPVHAVSREQSQHSAKFTGCTNT